MNFNQPEEPRTWRDLVFPAGEVEDPDEVPHSQRGFLRLADGQSAGRGRAQSRTAIAVRGGSPSHKAPGGHGCGLPGPSPDDDLPTAA